MAFDFNSLPVLPRTNPRCKLPFDVRAKQKLHYSTSLNRFSMYTFWHGNEYNENMWTWHTISEEDAQHLYRHARIPFVLTQSEEDWTVVQMPITATMQDVKKNILSIERDRAHQDMLLYEQRRQACMKATGWNGHGMIPEGF